MKNLFPLFFTLIASLSANGQIQTLDIFTQTVSESPTTQNGEPSRYSQLLLNFSSGKLPLPSTLEGAWSGRCYFRATPNEPRPMILAGKTISKNSDEDNGPLFPPPSPSTFLSVALVTIPGVTRPDGFDQLTDEDRRLLETLIGRKDFAKYAATADSGSVVSQNNGGNLKYLIRSYKNYFIAEAAVVHDETPYKAGQIYSACYFFKKILE